VGRWKWRPPQRPGAVRTFKHDLKRRSPSRGEPPHLRPTAEDLRAKSASPALHSPTRLCLQRLRLRPQGFNREIGSTRPGHRQAPHVRREWGLAETRIGGRSHYRSSGAGRARTHANRRGRADRQLVPASELVSPGAVSHSGVAPHRWAMAAEEEGLRYGALTRRAVRGRAAGRRPPLADGGRRGARPPPPPRLGRGTWYFLDSG